MNEDNPITVNVQREFKDFYKAIWWQIFRKFWVLYLLASILTVIWVYSWLKGIIMITPGLLMGQIPLFGAIILQWGIYSGAKKSAQAVKGTTQWSFSQAGYEIFTPVSTTKNLWESLVKIEKKKNISCFIPTKMSL